MEGMLFFANIIDEMTFNYTLESFKASVHNAFSLIRECIETIDDIQNETIKKGALPPITEEIKDALFHDTILEKVMKANSLDLVSSKIDGNTRKDELKLVLEMFLAKPVVTQYNDLLKKELADLIKNHGNQKVKIEKLARLFVAQMKFMGYPNASIYMKNKAFFFGRTAAIQSINDIDGFFALFDFNRQKYTVCHFGNHLYSYLQTALQSANITITNAFNLTNWNASYAGIANFMPPNKGQYIIMEIEALDEYHALLRATDRLTHFTSLYSFYHHKERFNFIRDEGIVKRDSDGVCFNIKTPKSSMLVCEDERPNVAANYYQQAITQIFLDNNSFTRFTKSVRLHDASIRSSHSENQFLNLFSALEVLIPKDPGSGRERIIQIADTMIPYLCQIHFQKIAASFGQDLRLWNNALYVAIMAQVTDGNTEDEKLCALLSLGKYQPQRNQIMTDATAANYYLLRYRLWKLNDRMGSVQKIKSTFSRFEQRMRWHITRLYRTRNLIVHAGAHPFYLDMLLENMHSFFDTFMRGLIFDISTLRTFKLEYSYLLRNQRYLKYTTYLNSLGNNDVIDDTNYLEILGMKY